MPVRIVFRGLMLFHFPETEPGKRKLVAWLLNDPAAAAGGGGPHNHSAEIQIVTGASSNELIPKKLRQHVNVDISITGGPELFRAASFDRHVANLETITKGGIDAVQRAGRGAPNRLLVQNVITVDRGLVRVKDVMAWDEGAFPLGGGPGTGNQASAPVLVSFVGSSVEGHMASEVIVEIDGSTTVTLSSNDVDKDLNGQKKGVAQPSHRHVPPNAVEILVTNYEPPSDKPTPWGLDFQRLFEAAGYRPADLSGAGRFDDWVTAGNNYDSKLLAVERGMLLTGPDNTIGWPFPFVETTRSITALTPLASPRNPPVCPFATTTLSLDQTLLAEGTPRSTRGLAPTGRARPAGRTATVGKAAKAKRSGKAPAKKSKTPAKKKSAKRKKR